MFDQTKADAIIAAIATGEPAYKAAAAVGIPHPTFWRWMANSQDLSDKYARAKEQGLERMADEILEIADDETLPADSRRVRVDPRKWLLSKLAPKKYGDKLDLAVSGSLTGLIEGLPVASRPEDR